MTGINGRADVVVIGAGIVGLTVALRLAQLGVRDVVVLEASEPGRQSTSRSSGGIRRQFGDRLEIELTLAGLRFYEPVFADPRFEGQFVTRGYAFLCGPDHADELLHAVRLQQEMGLEVIWLEPSELAERFPYVRTTGLVGGTVSQDDGTVDPWALVRWLLRGCTDFGVTVRRHSPVDAVELSAGHIAAVRSGAHRTVTSTLVIAAGAWTGRVAELAGLSIPVLPSPRCQVVTEPLPGLPTESPFVIDLETGAHMRTEGERAIVGVKPARMPVGFEVHYDSDPIASILERASVRFPAARDARVSGFISGLYEITPDGLPVAGAVEQIDGLYVVAGFNGHGIMHGPPLAAAVAEQIVQGRPLTFDLAPFSILRLGHRSPRRAVSFL